MNGLIAAYLLDRAGGGRQIEAAEIEGRKPEDGLLWVHLDYGEAEARAWLENGAGLSRVVSEAMLAHDPRPRSLRQGEGLLVVIRGINSNAHADPEDMVSLRIWLEADRVISVRHRSFQPIRAMRRRIAQGTGPTSPGDLLHQLYDLTLADIATLVDNLDAEVDRLEDQVLDGTTENLRHQLSLLRRQFITLRRHVYPQRQTIDRLPSHTVGWLTDIDRLNLGEAAEKQGRTIEELDSARERAAVTNEELEGRLSQLLDRRLYVLSLIAAISLPLGILTGLLGVNVGGIPMRTSPYGFAVTCGVLVLLSLGLLWLFRKLEWL